jgi:hypothetical protein
MLCRPGFPRGYDRLMISIGKLVRASSVKPPLSSAIVGHFGWREMPAP